MTRHGQLAQERDRFKHGHLRRSGFSRRAVSSWRGSARSTATDVWVKIFASGRLSPRRWRRQFGAFLYTRTDHAWGPRSISSIRARVRRRTSPRPRGAPGVRRAPSGVPAPRTCGPRRLDSIAAAQRGSRGRHSGREAHGAGALSSTAPWTTPAKGPATTPMAPRPTALKKPRVPVGRVGRRYRFSRNATTSSVMTNAPTERSRGSSAVCRWDQSERCFDDTVSRGDGSWMGSAAPAGWIRGLAGRPPRGGRRDMPTIVRPAHFFFLWFTFISLCFAVPLHCFSRELMHDEPG